MSHCVFKGSFWTERCSCKAIDSCQTMFSKEAVNKPATHKSMRAIEGRPWFQIMVFLLILCNIHHWFVGHNWKPSLTLFHEFWLRMKQDAAFLIALLIHEIQCLKLDQRVIALSERGTPSLKWIGIMVTRIDHYHWLILLWLWTTGISHFLEP